MINNQSQKSGNDSTNLQVQQMVVNVGIDEKRAREIYQEMNLQLRSDYTQEAFVIANNRVKEFEDRLMPKMAQVEGALGAFADPSFQLLLVNAQKTAAATERPADYDLLSELLIHRFKKGENRIARAGISLAVDIVDKVADDALLGLTVMHAVENFIPLTGDINQGLDVLNSLFGKILYSKLPVGQEWLDHLDILNAVRLNPLGGLKKIGQYYTEILPGYVDVGIKKNSENYNRAMEIIKGAALPVNTLIEHDFNNDFVRICTRDKSCFNELTINVANPYFGGVTYSQIKISKEQIDALESIYDLYSNDGNEKSLNIEKFIFEWDKRPNLKILREWWDNINMSITTTSVGKVLAHSNAQRCDKTLPPLN
ncbi:LPO_1073/Vpar_1526 family protein [Aeromonas sanarellii]|uniref:LPO_1073/Vpar_1526 family protein n=1 Tax=Aeromonas sanarellii TaxID=633415 RepID=UPI003B9F6F02